MPRGLCEAYKHANKFHVQRRRRLKSGWRWSCVLCGSGTLKDGRTRRQLVCSDACAHRLKIRQQAERRNDQRRARDKEVDSKP